MKDTVPMNQSITMYARSNNSKKIVILTGTRSDFRRRQRSVKINQDKVSPLRFVSFKETQHMCKKNITKVIGPVQFQTISKL